MNFLAHAYLSFGEPATLVGNMIADFVHGRQQKTFSPVIQEGIRLHRTIDNFTDIHKVTIRARNRLKRACGRYSGVFLDVVYDHFLANDDHFFSDQSLAAFAQQAYHTLDRFENILPGNFRQVFFYMKQQNWLYSYRSKEGMDHAFKGIYRRAKFLWESEAAFQAFEFHYDELKKDYTEFMPDLVDFVKNSMTGY